MSRSRYPWRSRELIVTIPVSATVTLADCHDSRVHDGHARWLSRQLCLRRSCELTVSITVSVTVMEAGMSWLFCPWLSQFKKSLIITDRECPCWSVDSLVPHHKLYRRTDNLYMAFVINNKKYGSLAFTLFIFACFWNLVFSEHISLNGFKLVLNVWHRAEVLANGIHESQLVTGSLCFLENYYCTRVQYRIHLIKYD
jgi:hypothetical protein